MSNPQRSLESTAPIDFSMGVLLVLLSVHKRALEMANTIRTCIVYRTAAKSLKSDSEQYNYNDADQPQFEACVFSDGRVAQRWLTPTGSTVWWDKWKDLCAVHIYAHPDYGTRIEWSDGIVENR